MRHVCLTWRRRIEWVEIMGKASPHLGLVDEIIGLTR